jgi:predicted RNase H-like HicB family nuclease
MRPAWERFPKIEWQRIARETLVLDRIKLRLSVSRELHYSTRDVTHFPCYELRGQETNVWCVGASVQMILDFYRYEYTQTRLGGGYWAEVPALGGCFTQGDSLEAVSANIHEAIECHLFSLLREGVPFPVEKRVRKSFVFPVMVRAPRPA